MKTLKVSRKNLKIIRDNLRCLQKKKPDAYVSIIFLAPYKDGSIYPHWTFRYQLWTGDYFNCTDGIFGYMEDDPTIWSIGNGKDCSKPEVDFDWRDYFEFHDFEFDGPLNYVLRIPS